MKEDLSEIIKKYIDGNIVEQWVCSILCVIVATLCLGIDEVRTLSAYNADFAERMLKDLRENKS